MGLIYFIVTVIILLIWFVIGLIMWIPMLTRGIAIYSLSLSYAAVVNAKPSYMKRRDSELKQATKFYLVGFKRIFEMFKSRNTEYEERIEGQKEEKMKIGVFILELLWTSVFWTGFLYLLMPYLLFPIVERLKL